jgi:ABC-type transport system substrate-binding protein
MPRLTRRTILKGAAGVSAATYLPLTSEFAMAQQARTMIVAMPATPEGFDGDVLKPGTQETVVQTYDALVRYGRVTRNGRPYLDPTKIEPLLAESWSYADGGRTFTFKLKQGVRSARGNELTAADVEWSWAKSFAQRRTGNFIAGVANVTGVKAASKYEVTFTLSAPSALLLPCLTLYVPSIYDSAEVKKHATADDPWATRWLDSNTAGFGPYHLEQIRPGEQAVFTANPNYHGAQPFFGRVVYRAVPSAASRVTLLSARQVQWIDRPPVQQVVELRRNQNVKVEDALGRAMTSIRMNLTIKPFDDIRVRRALNFALNKEAINEAVFFNTASPARSVVPPQVDGHDPSFFDYPHDPARARALLAEAGYPNGVEAELLYSDIWWWEESLAVQVSSQLRPHGINLKPTRITGADLRARAAPARQDLPIFTFEDGPIVLDPVYTFALMAHSTGVSNRGRYRNARLDELVNGARVELDRDKRLAMMREAQKIWVDDAPWLMTHYPTLFEAMNTNISGWTPHPDDHERWADLRAG